MGYDEGSQPQAEAARLGLGMLERAVASIPSSEVLRFADLGCGTGGNSVEPVRRVVAGWRQRSEGPIEVLHVDLPHNDFACVLENARGYAAPNVFRAAIAGSFYDPLFPPGSLHLVWSSTATHWLSRAPGPRHSRSTSEAAAFRRAWSEQARQDWERWLACRAVELAPGGQIVMVGSGADRFGRNLAEPLMEMLGPAVSPATYHRKLEEWLAPLGGTLRLLEAEEPAMADPFWEALERSGDVESYADRVLQFVLSSLGQAALPADLAPELRSRILAHPDQARCRWWVTLLRIERAG